MKIPIQCAVISIAAGLIVWTLSVRVIHDDAFLLAPAVTALLWAYYSKKERKN